MGCDKWGREGVCVLYMCCAEEIWRERNIHLRPLWIGERRVEALGSHRRTAVRIKGVCDQPEMDTDPPPTAPPQRRVNMKNNTNYETSKRKEIHTHTQIQKYKQRTVL